jgi:hypothetical protein
VGNVQNHAFALNYCLQLKSFVDGMNGHPLRFRRI